MPEVDVVLYKEDEDTVPLRDWLRDLTPKARVKCIARIVRLKWRGHELRRPEADYLRDDIYELRVGLQHVNYRILYFFTGKPQRCFPTVWLKKDMFHRQRSKKR